MHHTIKIQKGNRGLQYYGHVADVYRPCYVLMDKYKDMSGHGMTIWQCLPLDLRLYSFEIECPNSTIKAPRHFNEFTISKIRSIQF